MVDIAATKKRGRTSNSGIDSAVPTAGSPIETLPKKRGRPSKGKGRGRPAKVIAASSDNEDNDQNELDDTSDEQPIKTSGSGKGRGRPRKEPMPVDNNSDNDDANSVDDKPIKKQKKSSSTKRRTVGRPRKHLPIDKDNKEDDKEKVRRPVGRPAIGAVKWNIVRTGRKVGRPKKKRSLPVATPRLNADGSIKKRGRPKANNTSPRVIADDAHEQIDESVQEVNSDEPEQLSAVISTPKKRGRPSLLFNSTSTPLKEKLTEI